MGSRIVIAGAGIGGLTAALALAARGIDCLVLEKADVLTAVGAGIQLSPNASHILIALGLGEAIGRVASRPAGVTLSSVRAGGPLLRLPLPQDEAAPYWVIHRADLQAPLLAQVARQPRIALQLGTTIASFEEQPGAVRIAAGRETIEASALIAADGVHSVVRQKLFPSSGPMASGRTAWRGLGAKRAASNDVSLWMGPRAHLVAYPAGQRTNLVVTLPASTDATTERTGPYVAKHLAMLGWPRAACEMVAAADRLTRYPLLTVPPLPEFSSGRVALLGDAAHAMLPFAAQGAGLAIEDAAVLARCIAATADVQAALSAYSRERRARTVRVAQAARQSGRIYHLNAALAPARDSAIRLIGARRLLKRQSWIYDWRA